MKIILHNPNIEESLMIKLEIFNKILVSLKFETMDEIKNVKSL
jgi:hypothetical protein